MADVASRHGASTIWLFGSSTGQGQRGRDLDRGVEEVPPGRFFNFAGELMLSLSQPVDVVAVGGKPKLNALIRRDGIQIDGQLGRES